MAALTDECYMPTGKYKDKLQMANVPADYLLWLYDNHRASPRVNEYIRDNLEALKEEVGRHD